MPLPQDIRPAFQNIQDTLIRADQPWIEQSPTSSMKVLWVGRESGTWAVLIRWKKGHVARPHKHLGGGARIRHIWQAEGARRGAERWGLRLRAGRRVA